MSVIIRKNDDLQRELSIVTRALELQTQAQQAEVDKVKEQNAELAAQVAEAHPACLLSSPVGDVVDTRLGIGNRTSLLVDQP